MQTKKDKDAYPLESHTITPMDQYDDVHRMLANSVLHDPSKTQLEPLWCCKQKAIPAFMFVAEHNIEDAPVCDASSCIIESMVT